MPSGEPGIFSGWFSQGFAAFLTDVIFGWEVFSEVVRRILIESGVLLFRLQCEIEGGDGRPGVLWLGQGGELRIQGIAFMALPGDGGLQILRRGARRDRFRLEGKQRFHPVR